VDKPITVLFLCTGNSARSILAESYLNSAGGGRLRAVSAGSFPKGAVHPLSIATLKDADIDASGARSKSWDEFAHAGAPSINIVITVCDNAAGEVCPIFPGAPVKAHWSFPDPAAVEGSERERRAAFDAVFADIRRAIDRMIALPIAQLAPAELSRRLNAIVAG
jgi:arsenate reductase